MSKLSTKIIIAVVLVVLVGGGAFYFLNRDNTELSAGAITAKLEDASDCTTQKLIYNGAVTSKKGKIPFINKSSFLMTYTATVKAGFDISESKVDITDDKILITIPPMSIQGIEIEPESLEFYDTSMALFSPDGKQETKKALKAAKKDAEKKAKDSELLEAAGENAEKLVKGLIVDSAGDREIVVEQTEK